MSKSPAPWKMPGGVIAPKGGGGGGGGKGGKAPKVMPGGRIKTAHQHHKRAHQKKPRVMPGGRIKRAQRHPKRGLAGTALGGWWITGGNDEVANCAAVAVANSRLLATGQRVSDGELLRLHDRAGPLSIPEAFMALGAKAFTEDGREGLSVIGLATPHGPHAALILGDALVTWGGLIPWPDDWALEEAWEVTWPS